MKHAFLIIAHNNWWQLKQLLHQLDYENHEIFIHIDKKSRDFDKTYFENSTVNSKVHIYQQYKVYWGGYSQVEVEMFLMKKSSEQYDFDYYHIISNADLLICGMHDFHLFFEENKGKEFIQYDEKTMIENPEIKRRTKLYHFLQNYRRRYNIPIINQFFTFLERILLGIQLLFNINRVKNLDWEIKFGPNWVSITGELVAEVLNQQEKIKKVFSYTNSADELFVQTIAFNCGFRDSIYCVNNKTYNLRLVDWSSLFLVFL